MANTLSLLSTDKMNKTKVAETAMNKVSEILMLGRSMSIRFFCSVQRPDALAFPAGSRLNYGVIIVLGAATRSIYEMLIPDHIDKTKEREFNAGEGVLLLQGAKLHFIKIPFVRDVEAMQQICINSLS